MTESKESADPIPSPPTARTPAVALVTGGARRIGRAIALALASDGWDVVVHYGRSQSDAEETVAAIEALGRRAIALQCDLADASATSALIGDANTAFAKQGGGALSCLVNSASIFEFDRAIDFSAGMLKRHIDTNLVAPILLAQALHAATPADQQAVVINLLDQKLFNLNPDYLSYTLSKAGLHTATTMLAQALAPKVRVVGLAPGITMVSGDQDAAGFEKSSTVTPLGYSSKPDDIAAAVCYLARAKAITGTTLVVDGGQHLISLPRDVMFLAT